MTLEFTRPNSKTIETRLSARLQSSIKDFKVYVVEETESTNTDLLRSDTLKEAPYCVLMTLKQSHGRGRHGRAWLSDEGSLTFSVRWQFKRTAQELNGLTLAVAVAILYGLGTLGIHSISIKWPNDLLKGSGKLGGILTEIGKPLFEGMTHAVIGIGINIQRPKQHAELNHEVAALFELLDDEQSLHWREETFVAIVQSLLPALVQFDNEGFSAFRKDWLAHAAWLGKQVALSSGTSGTMIGVDQDGALLLDTELCIERFLSGDLSLAPV